MCNPVGQGVGLSGTRTGDDQKRRRDGASPAHAVFDRAALRRIQSIEICRSAC
jgi:hypothetical protein